MIGAAASCNRANQTATLSESCQLLSPMLNPEIEENRDETTSSEIVRCYLDRAVTFMKRPARLSSERLLATQALRLLMVLDDELREARADWNQDRFRRVMHARMRAVLRVFRRWSRLNPQPVLPLGSLRRRYHANLAGYRYLPKA